jgi:hypothetical protein
LVINLTDDDDNGTIDLCDTPDLVVHASAPSAFTDPLSTGHLYVLNGENGDVQFRIERATTFWSTPAVGDIDGDGLPEIVQAETLAGPLLAWNHDGTPLMGWDESFVQPGTIANFSLGFAAVALADLDADGSVEVLADRYVFASDGTLLVELPRGSRTTTAADLDGDGQLEVITGGGIYRDVTTGSFTEVVAFPPMTLPEPHVADLDGDGDPEVLVVHRNGGLNLYDHTGAELLTDHKPFDDPNNTEAWGRSAAIHDFDGDGQVEVALSVGSSYLIMRLAPGPVFEVLRQWPVLDSSGEATGTAFDFLGDGTAEAMYADETQQYVFDGADDTVPALVTTARSSRTLIEYPVVADVDNDGSAEIVVVSNEDFSGAMNAPTVQVWGDADDRWIQARRVWNQHSYHVTNVMEDGRIPAGETDHWTTFNTVRTNAQIEPGGGACIPPVD